METTTITKAPSTVVPLVEQYNDSVRIENLLVSGSMLGTERHLRVFRFGDPSATPKVYLQAGLHGGEIPGMLVLQQLAQKLRDTLANGSLKGEVILVPVSNPLGISQQIQGELVGRFNLATGQNFNRDFPALEFDVGEIAAELGADGQANSQAVRRKAISILDEISPRDELESIQIHQLRLALSADYILDCHCDGDSLLHVYCSKAGSQHFEFLARRMRAAAMLVGSDSPSGCLDERINSFWDTINSQLPHYTFSRKSFAATLELRGRADVEISLAEKDADDIYKALQRWGVVAGVLPPDTGMPVRCTPLDALYSARAKYAGLVVYHKALGDYCEAGDLIASIIDPNTPFSAELQRLVAPVSGVLFSRNVIKLVAANTVVFKLAGEQPLEHTSDRSLLEE